MAPSPHAPARLLWEQQREEQQQQLRRLREKETQLLQALAERQAQCQQQEAQLRVLEEERRTLSKEVSLAAPPLRGGEARPGQASGHEGWKQTGAASLPGLRTRAMRQRRAFQNDGLH